VKIRSTKEPNLYHFIFIHGYSIEFFFGEMKLLIGYEWQVDLFTHAVDIWNNFFKLQNLRQFNGQKNFKIFNGQKRFENFNGQKSFKN